MLSVSSPMPAAALLLLLTALPMLAMAEPCTLYKPNNVETARANLGRHKWARDIVEGWKRAVAFTMDKDREFLADIVPDLTPGSTYGQVCPHCVGEKCAMGETSVLSWTVHDPDKLVCRYCKTEYPNPDYPETGVLECPNMGQRFTYYINDEQRAHPGEDLGKYAYRWAGRPVQVSFTGVMRAARVGWAVGRVPYLAKLYAVTGEAIYAERTAWLLSRLAEVFPKYLYHSYGGCFADCPPAEAADEMGKHPSAGKFAPGIICHPAAIMRDRNKDGYGDLDAGFWGAGRLTTGAGGEGGALLNITVAYDLTRDASYPDGTPVYTKDMHERITRDLILAGCHDMENYDAINNKCGPGRALSGAVGIMFQQPQRVRRALVGFEQLMRRCFHFDGFCTESPAYSSMHLGLMEEIPDLLAGYSDPPDYTPEEGERFDSFDPFTRIPRYALALQSMVRMLRPDLRFPVIGDTHAGGGTSPHFIEILCANYGPQYAGLLEALQGAPLSEKGTEYALWHRDPDLTSAQGPGDPGLRSEYFPGWRVGVMRAGKDDTQTAFYLNGYSMHGHRHYDTLGVLYHAYGQELASDRGYIWDDPRNAWTKSTLSHNIVTVDEANQVSKERHSKLELCGFAPGIEIMQMSANAYEQCSEYRRTCALVRLPGGGNYVADIFRVTGGKTHHYGFNSNGDFISLQGTAVAPIEGKLSWLTNLRATSDAPGNWDATWDCRGVKMRLLGTGPIDRLLVTDAPGWRTYKGDQLHAPPITQLLAERKAEEGLRSVFTAVMCPFEGEQCPVKSIRLVPAEPPSEEATCIAVTLEGCTDYIISAPDDEPRRYGPITLAGRFGMASVDAEGNLLRGYLLDGAQLTCGDTSVYPGEPRQTYRVTQVDGSTVRLDRPVTGPQALKGAYVLTGSTGFEVDSIEDDRLTVRSYPFVGGEQIIVPSAVWFDSTRQ